MTNDVYTKTDIVYSAVINGRTVVLNMETGRFYHLDETGCLIWQLLEKPSTVSDVAAGVAKECGISVSECEADVAGFMDSLCSKNLITKITEM